MIVAISTCPRPTGVDYFHETYDACRAQWPEPIEIYNDLHLEGSAVAVCKFLQMLAKFDDDVLLLEDDVIPCRNAIEAVRRLAFPPGCEMLSFFKPGHRHAMVDGVVMRVRKKEVNLHTNLRFDGYPHAPGIFFEPAGPNFGYAQALKLSKRLVNHIANAVHWPDDDELCTPQARKYMPPHSIRDNALGYFAREISNRIGLVVPNWFEHRGDVSSVMLSGSHLRILRGADWIGPEHDALADDVSTHYPEIPV